MTGTASRILVPTDFSEPSDAGLAYAKTVAKALGASLHLLHVLPHPGLIAYASDDCSLPVLPPQTSTLSEAETSLAARMSAAEMRQFRATTAVVTGLTASQIVQYASEQAIDLIVMGTHGRRGIAHLMLGSVAEHVVRTAACPVLTVRHTPASEPIPDRHAVLAAEQFA
jgi:universal stress protein A